MIMQENRRFALHLLIGVFVIALLAITLLRLIFSEGAWWILASKSMLPAIAMVIAIASWPKCYTFLVQRNNKVLFLPPLLDLNGVWRVEIKSNWSRIQQLTGTSVSSIDQVPLKKVTGTLSLQCDFFQTRGYFQVDDADSDRSSRTKRSDIVASSLRKENNYYVFSYMAKAVVSDPATETDEQNYLFSAEVMFSKGEMNRGGGQYWTNRKYNTGHNAAGELTLVRNTEN